MNNTGRAATDTRLPMAQRKHPLIRNLSAKLAATPMIATALVAFIGCSVWSVIYTFTASRSLPNEKFVGLIQYDRLFGSSRWMVSLEKLAIYGVCALLFSLLVGFLLAVALDQKIRLKIHSGLFFFIRSR